MTMSSARRTLTPAKRKTPRLRVKVKTALTLAMGTGIPLLSLGLSNVAGTLLQSGHWALAAMAGLLTVSVLVVSLPHIAWSVRDITGTDRRASWALAVAVDMALVLCELVHVVGVSPLLVVTTAIMVATTGASMLLNCWAFLMHSR